MKEGAFVKLEGKKVGFVFTGSFCTFKKVIEELKNIKKAGADIIPIMSYNAYNLDTKFGTAEDFRNEIKEITGKDEIIHTIQGAEPIGPNKLTDIMVVAPCSRKYYSKTCKFYNRWSWNNVGKVSFKK